MTKSKDGRSPDAAGTAHRYVAALDELNESLGQFLPQGNWRDALVNFSFDNCSVNMRCAPSARPSRTHLVAINAREIFKCEGNICGA